MFNQTDLQQLQAKGVSLETIEKQIESFKNGFPFLNIDRAASVGDGIVSLDGEQVQLFAQQYQNAINEKGLRIEKFVPASGAATRMFKDIFEAVEGDENSVSKTTLENIEKFAFHGELLEKGVDMTNPKAVLDAIVREPLAYGAKPKALIKFHSYGADSRTALMEQMVEGALYGESEGVVNIHFTVSPEHLELFNEMVEDARAGLEEKFAVRYNINYSTQKSSTDTLAVDMDNKPFRDSEGKLLFRPAGHGALLENLDAIDADLIYIKTVDNVQPDHRKDDTVSYKKALAWLAISLQERVFEYIRAIDEGDADPEVVIGFIEANLGYRFGEATNFDHLREVLSRPLRVCGMVRNVGEPGGGPFWVKGADGSMSLQIAESSQISPQQKSLMSDSTHFNPVDLVCMTRDIDGVPYDLGGFTDPTTGFISTKSFQGKQLKAQELPGLWNGAMANWNTAFVEVPLTTFSPVKIITDLLRVEHQ